MIDGITDSLQLHLFAVDDHFAGNVCSVASSENTHCELGSACTHQSGNTDNLTLADIDGNIVYHLTLCIQRMMNGPVLDLQIDLADLYIRSLREPVCNLTTYHAADNTVLADFIFTFYQCLDGSTITDHGNLVSHISNLIQLMRNNDTGHSLLLQLQKQIQKCLGICLI